VKDIGHSAWFILHSPCNESVLARIIHKKAQTSYKSLIE
jgi:hypothetical protein